MTDTNKEITLKAFEELCKNLVEQKEKCKAIEKTLDAEKEKFNTLSKNVMAYMTELGKDSYSIAGGGTIYISNHFSAQTPKTIEQKKEFFKWLEDNNLFYEYLNVNANSLSTLVQHEEEEALKRGEIDFKIPGIGDSKWSKRLNYRSK